MAALPADHRLARHDRIALSDLAGEPFVFFPRHRSVLGYVRFVPATGHRLTLQVAWAADNTNTALPAFLQTARHITAQAPREAGAGAGATIRSV